MNQRIVIIGGMGPQASLELHKRLIASAANAGACKNDDYPEILHASIPVVDFINSDDKLAAIQYLYKVLDNLQLRYSDKIILACNTAHLLVPQLEERYSVRFISLIDATVQKISEKAEDKIAILASPTTINSRLFEQPLVRYGYSVISPTHREMQVLEKAIRHIIANRTPADMIGKIEPIILRMRNDGASRVILGCSELSVILADYKSQCTVDPLNAVCEQIFERGTI